MKVPKAKRLPSGSWHIQLRLGGQSISITEATEKACIQKAQLVKAEHLAGRPKVKRDTAPTLDKMLESYIKAKKAVLSPSTVRGYEAYRRTRFQAYKDRDPARINWQRMVNEENRLCGPKTLKNAWNLVSAAIKFSGDPAPAVALPQVVSDEHPFLDPDQIPVFLETVRDTAWELPALFALHGLRRSEAFALTWADLDLKANVMHVRGALVHDEDGKLVKKKENKNRSSRRTVPIMIPRLAELLAAEASVRTGPASDLVLICHPNSLYKAVNSRCKKSGLPLIGTHGLRHTFVSLCYSLGISELATMSMAGYRDYQTMRKIYTHLAEADRLKASNAISSFFENANAKMLTPENL